jgi:hypothetical protein
MPNLKDSGFTGRCEQNELKKTHLEFPLYQSCRDYIDVSFLRMKAKHCVAPQVIEDSPIY